MMITQEALIHGEAFGTVVHVIQLSDRLESTSLDNYVESGELYIPAPLINVSTTPTNLQDHLMKRALQNVDGPSVSIFKELLANNFVPIGRIPILVKTKDIEARFEPFLAPTNEIATVIEYYDLGPKFHQAFEDVNHNEGYRAILGLAGKATLDVYDTAGKADKKTIRMGKKKTTIDILSGTLVILPSFTPSGWKEFEEGFAFRYVTQYPRCSYGAPL